VPADDNLVVDAKIAPNDIDIVRIGLPAFVHLVAYASQGTPKVEGTVKSVSADRLIDEATRQPYYLARVEVKKDEIERLSTAVELIPGMPAEIMIVTDRRTLIEYLFEPLTDAWRKSFREA
jgi:HlyD family secretion protein/epimerase transport system membrane fusion protein